MLTEQWFDRAACKKSYDLRFFGSRLDQREARTQYCDDCTVQTQCTAVAIREHQKYGLWGGMLGKGSSERE